MRQLTFRWHGAIRAKTKTFYPVWDWKLAEVHEVIRKAGLQLPRDYEIWGRSFDGLDYRHLVAIKRHFPADYEKILDWFPLIDAELFRKEIADGERRV